MSYTDAQITQRAIRPIGNKLMFTCEVTGDTGGTIITGLGHVEYATASPRGSTDNNFRIDKSGGTLTLASFNSSEYTVKAIGR